MVTTVVFLIIPRIFAKWVMFTTPAKKGLIGALVYCILRDIFQQQILPQTSRRIRTIRPVPRVICYDGLYSSRNITVAKEYCFTD